MKRIIFLTAYPIEDGSARYRIYQFLPALRDAGFDCKVRPFATSGLYGAIRKGKRSYLFKAAHLLYATIRRLLDILLIHHYDLVVIHREAFPFATPLLERVILSIHPNVVFSFDDAIYAGHGNVKELRHPLLYRFKHGKGVDEVIRRAAHVIAGNSTLADYAYQLNRNVTILPTVVSLDHYQLVPKKGAGVVTIGWYGSDSTSPYLKVIEPALKKVSELYGNKVRFRFIGDENLRCDLLNLDVSSFDLSSEIEDLSSFDIGLMPLPDTAWTRGKCSFKAIQYMALGIAAVVSPVGMAADVIQHRVTGFHAETVEDWVTYLSLLIEDVTLRLQVGRAARRSVSDKYSYERWVNEVISLFQRLTNDSLIGEWPGRAGSRESA